MRPRGCRLTHIRFRDLLRCIQPVGAENPVMSCDSARTRGGGRRAGLVGVRGWPPPQGVAGCRPRAGVGAVFDAGGGRCSAADTRAARRRGGVVQIRKWSRHSRRRVPMNRSAIAFAGGARIGVRTKRMSAPVKTASNAAVNLLSRSRIRNRNRSARWPRSINRLRACWLIHAAVGGR